MPDPAWLTGLQPDGQPGRWLLDKDETLIGREAPADLILPSLLISRRHAIIARSELGYFLADLGSRNGTFVNGQAMGETPQRLQANDEIVLGGVVTMRFHDPGETVQGPRIGRLKRIWLDEAAHAVWVDASLLEPPFSPAQYTLLRLLYERIGQTVSRAHIIATVWPDVDPTGVSEEAVDGLIKRLRERLRQAQQRSQPVEAPQPEYLEVVRGHGLRLSQPKE